jgi:hypothetical protein
MFIAIGAVVILAWGAIRPQMKKEAAERRKMEQSDE